MVDQTEVEALSILYAMEHDLPAKIVFDLCWLICTTDRKSLEGVQIFQNSAPRRELIEHMRLTSDDWRVREFRANVHQNDMMARLKAARLVR